MAIGYDFLSTSNGGGDAALMHVTGARLVGAMTLAVDSVLNVPAKFIGTSGTLASTGFIDPATKTDFTGHISGATLVIDAFMPGSADLGNTIGQVVVIKPNTSWANGVINNALIAHNPDGTLKDGIVTTTKILDANVTTVKIADTSVTKPKIDWSTFALNMKSALNTSNIGLINSSQDLASNGLVLSFTVSSACKALVDISLGIYSTTDYEFNPQIRLGGVVISTYAPTAAYMSGGRANVRGYSAVIDLVAGVNTISAGVNLISSTSAGMGTNAGSISALVLGNVTA